VQHVAYGRSGPDTSPAVRARRLRHRIPVGVGVEAGGDGVVAEPFDDAEPEDVRNDGRLLRVWHEPRLGLPVGGLGGNGVLDLVGGVLLVVGGDAGEERNPHVLTVVVLTVGGGGMASVLGSQRLLGSQDSQG
jgi:hypothetical protein